MAISLDGCILALPHMNSHAMVWIFFVISGPGAVTEHVYQAFESTRELNSMALPAKVSVLAFRDQAFLRIHSYISSHFSSIFFLLSGKVKPSVGGWLHHVRIGEHR